MASPHAILNSYCDAVAQAPSGSPVCRANTARFDPAVGVINVGWWESVFTSPSVCGWDRWSHRAWRFLWGIGIVYTAPCLSLCSGGPSWRVGSICVQKTQPCVKTEMIKEERMIVPMVPPTFSPFCGFIRKFRPMSSNIIVFLLL